MTTLAPKLHPSPAGEPGTGFGVYIHWPFCQAKCPYCDFNSHVARQIDQARWAAALRSEVARVSATVSGENVTSVFFGGGTPSTMAPETVGAVLDAIGGGWTVADDVEVTMEANPTSVDAGNFAGYRAAGVTRLSLGVQALNDADLQRLGRLHSADDARAAFDVARQSFDRVSFDLICARQHQTREAWRTELAEALSLAVGHISLYQLTIEPGTPFAERHARGGLRGLPDEDLGADLYEMTLEMCTEAGLDLYEVSNFARPGEECRHNLLYWSGGAYAGIGPGAHGRLERDGLRLATEQVSQPGRWLNAVESGAAAHETVTVVEPKDQALEYIMMGIRKKDGLDMDHLSALSALPSGFSTRVDELRRLGLLESTGHRVRATTEGRLVLDATIAELVLE